MLDEVFSYFREFLPLLAAGGIAVSATGLARIGPGRAVSIALRSRFASKPVPESLRLAEIQQIKGMISKAQSQSYVVVTGVKGVGKTCLINTVTSKTPGVIKVKAYPGQNVDSILKNALQRLTGLSFDFALPFDSAKRVIFWHRLLTLGRPPIVVISATDRGFGEEYADLTNAVRQLVEDYKVRVVVSGSPNSLIGSLFRTHRQRVFDIKPMTKEMVWQLEQLQDLFKYVKEAGLDDVVFAVLGGFPAGYKDLRDDAKFDMLNGQNPRQVIGTLLCAEIFDAINLVKDSKTMKNDMDEIIKLFDKETKCIPIETLSVKKLQRPTTDNVFR